MDSISRKLTLTYIATMDTADLDPILELVRQKNLQGLDIGPDGKQDAIEVRCLNFVWVAVQCDIYVICYFTPAADEEIAPKMLCFGTKLTLRGNTINNPHPYHAGPDIAGEGGVGTLTK